MRLTVFFFLLLNIHISVNAHYLFHDSNSDYAITVSETASQSEKTAAKELQTYIHKISGALLPIKNTAEGHFISIGWTEATKVRQPRDDDESFTYMTIGENIYIYGGRNRGTMYGVFSFLEQELGIRWYTSYYTKIPTRKFYEVKPLNHSEKPAIKKRLNYYKDALSNPKWGAHNLINSHSSYTKNNYGDYGSYWGMHSLHTLISEKEYFASHPEYFSLNNGKRTRDAQRCLSNEGLRKEVIRKIKNVIATNPGYWCYDVSQNDISAPCECEDCKRLVDLYGGQSGILLWFVNQVAKEVKKDFPDVYIGTFAYRYTRQAPKSDIVPEDNVVIRLCDIECCMAHSFNECSQNRSFLRDFNDWKKKTRNIYIWDYTTGFLNYLLPFPNLKAKALNYQFFAEHNIIGLMEEGQYNSPWGEFTEMKQWIIAKLLWNPYQDTDSLARIFIKDYYGKAAPYVQSYYDLCTRQISSNTHFTIKIDWSASIFDDAFEDKALSIVDKAMRYASYDKTIQKRTNRIAAQVYYLKFRRHSASSLIDGTYDTLEEIIKNDPTITEEWGETLETIRKKLADT